MQKDKIIVFTIADQNNEKYANMLQNSFKKFHPDIDFHIVKDEELATYLKNDPNFFYRATPVLAEAFLNNGYDLAIKIDADSIVTGDLSEVFDCKYDVATVYNWNKVDPKMYGEIGLLTIHPTQYYNCGFVALRSAKFAKHWKDLCYSYHFDAMPFREQGFLNVLAYYGGYEIKCMDDGDGWWGLRSKGEWNKCQMIDGKMVLARAMDNYPERDKQIKIIHWAGGSNGSKMNYKAFFNDECSGYLDNLINEKKE